MMWVKKRAQVGDTRVIKRFALFPIRIVKIGYTEIRWLEVVYIRQVLSKRDWEDSSYWDGIDFVDSDEYYEYIEKIIE